MSALTHKRIKTIFRYLIFLLVIVFAIQVGYAKPSTNTHQNSAQNSNTNVQPISLQSPVAQVVTKRDSEQEARQQEQEARDEAFRTKQIEQNETIANANWRIMIFTGISVAITFFFALFSFGQWRAMRESTQFSRDALTKLERPFVFVKGFRSVWHHDWDEGRKNNFWYSFHVQLENTGKSPAKDAYVTLEHELRDSPLPKDFNFPLDREPMPFVLGASGTLQVGFDEMRLLDDQMILVRDRKKRYYVWGKVTYQDEFDRTEPHETLFCSELSPIVGNPGNAAKEKVEVYFSMHPTQNSYK